MLGILVIAALLAFPLRETVYQMIVVPLAYLGWLLKLFYLSISQGVWWLVVAVVALFAIGRSLLPEINLGRKLVIYKKAERGSVETLSAALAKRDRGIYFKWLVANRLGKLAYQFLTQREHGKPRSVFAPLTAAGWDSPPEIQEYLEKGLRGSFAEFPSTRWNTLATPAKTPLDQDVRQVIEFLESQSELVHGPPGHA
jgi:hypothetical protein